MFHTQNLAALISAAKYCRLLSLRLDVQPSGSNEEFSSFFLSPYLNVVRTPESVASTKANWMAALQHGEENEWRSCTTVNLGCDGTQTHERH